MKTRVSDSSIEAYHNQVIGRCEPTQSKQIEDYVLFKGRCTRSQIAQDLGFKESLVGARVNKLINIDKTLIEELSKFQCPINPKSKVHFIYHKDYKAGQKELFQ